MSHNCRTLLLRCIDFRLCPAIHIYLEGKKLLGACDIVSVAGAAKNIASPVRESDREFVLRQIEISKKLHDIKQVIIMNHTDCGAYGGHAAFASGKDEENRHVVDMKMAADLIRKNHSELIIKIELAKISDQNETSFEGIE